MMVKKLKMIKMLEDMRNSVERCCVFDLTFSPIPSMSKEDRTKLEEYFKCNFNLWANSWILPRIKELIGELRGETK